MEQPTAVRALLYKINIENDLKKNQSPAAVCARNTHTRLDRETRTHRQRQQQRNRPPPAATPHARSSIAIRRIDIGSGASRPARQLHADHQTDLKASSRSSSSTMAALAKSASAAAAAASRSRSSSSSCSGSVSKCLEELRFGNAALRTLAIDKETRNFTREKNANVHKRGVGEDRTAKTEEGGCE